MHERSELRFFRFFFLDGKTERLLCAELGQPRANQRPLPSPWEDRRSVSSSVSLRDPPCHAQLFANTCFLLGGAVSWNPAMAPGLELISGGTAWERRAQLL